MESYVADMPVAEAEAIIADAAERLLYSWSWTARADQLAATDDNAHIVGMIAGRGGGKTRTGSEKVRKATTRGGPPRRIALVGRTAADVRDTMIQGESGILNVFPPSEMPKYTPTARRIDFKDGSVALCFSAQEPDQLRGPQFHESWADELATWDFRPDDSGLNAWDNLQFATRLGDNPQILFTTTPKRIKFLKDLLKQAVGDPEISIYNQASTYDNIHLAERYLKVVRGVYGGTRLAGQEIYGILSDAVEGALWLDGTIERNRVHSDPGKLPINVVGVDPTVSDDPDDECGIVVVGATPKAASVYDRTGYVLADRTVQGPPRVWVPAVCQAARDYDAVVVAESNQGGALVRDSLLTHDPGITVRLVHAKDNKKLRADPVSLASEQNRLKFLYRFPELEDQLTTWVPLEDPDSPDRLDALVHACTGLITIVKKKSRTTGGRARATNPGSKVVIPTGRRP